MSKSLHYNVEKTFKITRYLTLWPKVKIFGHFRHRAQRNFHSVVAHPFFSLLNKDSSAFDYVFFVFYFLLDLMMFFSNCSFFYISLKIKTTTLNCKFVFGNLTLNFENFCTFASVYFYSFPLYNYCSA